MMKKLLKILLKIYMWATIRLYYEFAWAYDLVSWLVSLGQWSKWRNQSLEHIRGKRVLEMGCGTGELLFEMQARQISAVGLDLSPKMIRVAHRKMKKKNVKLKVILGKTQSMPFPTDSFDTLISTFPAEYILDPQTLQESARVLNPKHGRLIIAGTSLQSNNPILQEKMQKQHPQEKGSSLKLFEKSAAEAGFSLCIYYPPGKWFISPVILLDIAAQSTENRTRFFD